MAESLPTIHQKRMRIVDLKHSLRVLEAERREQASGEALARERAKAEYTEATDLNSLQRTLVRDGY